MQTLFDMSKGLQSSKFSSYLFYDFVNVSLMHFWDNSFSFLYVEIMALTGESKSLPDRYISSSLSGGDKHFLKYYSLL